MRLEHLSDLDLAYTTEFLLIRPYGTQEGAGYGEGDGTAHGRLAGRVRWVNHPRRRSDGAMLPDAAGYVQTDDDHTVLFSFQGRTPTEGPKAGQQLLRVRFEAEAPYDWLNTVFAVAEGKVDFETMRALIRVYECVHDLE